MIDDTVEALDGLVFGNGAAVADLRPAGLLFGINAADTTVLAGSTLIDIDTALRSRIRQLFAVRRLGKRPVWVMKTSNKLALMGVMTVAWRFPVPR